MILKDGSSVDDNRLDRLYELDWNSLNYPVTMQLEAKRELSTYSPRSYTWFLDETLDQGADGACVGFSYAHDLLSRPQAIRVVNAEPVDRVYAKEKIYWNAQTLDEWPGGSYPGATPVYEGTSILAGAKVMQERGFYSSYYWALDLQQLVLGVGYSGPCIFGIKWYNGMFAPDDKGFVAPSGELAGGHAMLIYGVKIVYKNWVSRLVSRTWDNVDLDKSYFKIKNSWGPNWGVNGSFYMTLRNAEKLLNDDGDACFPNRIYS